MRVAFCLAHSGEIKIGTFTSILKTMGTTRAEYTLLTEQSCYVQSNRHTLATRALAQGADAVFFFDWDMLLDPETVNVLLAHNQPAVGVDYAFRGVIPRRSTVSLLPDVPPADSLYEVAGLGTGCLLIRREAFEQTPQPWFNVKMNDETGAIEQGEDVWFCNRARQFGVKLYCDPTLKIGHVGDYNYE